MTTAEILQTVGSFSPHDAALFEQHTKRLKLKKNGILLPAGEVCTSFYFILSGAFVQFQLQEVDESIVDLHLPQEWMFIQDSLTAQLPSTTTIRAFSSAEVMELSLYQFHQLSSLSPAFLQFGKILNQAKSRTFLFDNALTPKEKYHYINQAKPGLTKVFPVKLIASYLKIAPETLSRVRANR